MKKFLILMTASLLFSFPVNATEKEKPEPATVTTNLNVRQRPSTSSKILKVLQQNEEIEVYKTFNKKWDKIILEDNSVGYVYNLYLEKNNKDDKKKTQQTEVQKPKRQIEITDFQYAGVINWGGWSWTYYLMSMFPGSTSTPCPDRWVNDEGFVCDPDGYIILASVDLPPYTVVETPFGYMGKVYDTGCPSGILDVYTNW